LDLSFKGVYNYFLFLRSLAPEGPPVTIRTVLYSRLYLLLHSLKGQVIEPAGEWEWREEAVRNRSMSHRSKLLSLHQIESKINNKPQERHGPQAGVY